MNHVLLECALDKHASSLCPGDNEWLLFGGLVIGAFIICGLIVAVGAARDIIKNYKSKK